MKILVTRFCIHHPPILAKSATHFLGANNRVLLLENGIKFISIYGWFKVGKDVDNSLTPKGF